MYFELSKIVFFFLQPSSLALVALAAGLSLMASKRRVRSGRRLAIAGVAYLAIAGFLPVGTALLLPLEERFGTRMPEPPAGGVRGIIILGGFEEGTVSAWRGGLAVNEAADRLTEGVRLARKLPDALVVFTGGVGTLFGGEDAGAAVAAYFADMGLAKERVVIESNSRNTVENADFTRDLVRPRPGERFVLVTSAYHMPRSVGVFRAAGFDVIAYPVDFRTLGRGDLLSVQCRMPHGLERTDVAAKEWIGLVVTWLRGRSSALLPGP